MNFCVICERILENLWEEFENILKILKIIFGKQSNLLLTLHIIPPCSWKTVVTNVAICGWALSRRMITQLNICEHVCQTSGLNILWKRRMYTCWSMYDHMALHMQPIHLYNCEPLSSFPQYPVTTLTRYPPVPGNCSYRGHPGTP